MAMVLPLQREPRTPKSRRSLLKVVSNPKVADTQHGAHANHFYENSDALRHAVDGEVAFDVVGFLSGGFDAGTAKGEPREFLNVEEIIGAQHLVVARRTRVQAGGLHGHRRRVPLRDQLALA